MATRTWSNSSERGAVEQVAGRTWANTGGAGAVEDPKVVAVAAETQQGAIELQLVM